MKSVAHTKAWRHWRKGLIEKVTLHRVGDMVMTSRARRYKKGTARQRNSLYAIIKGFSPPKQPGNFVWCDEVQDA